MATKKVNFIVTPSEGIKAYWIAVGEKNVPLVNGKGSVFLETNRKHFLVWWMVGNSGANLSIIGKENGDNVVEVKKSKIPPGEHEGAGAKRFKLD